MGGMSKTGTIRRVGNRQDTVPHPANPRAGKATTAREDVGPTSPIQKSGALGHKQDAEPGAPTRVGGGANEKGFSRRMGIYNNDGPGAQWTGANDGTFPPLDTGQAQDGGRAGGYGGS